MAQQPALSRPTNILTRIWSIAEPMQRPRSVRSGEKTSKSRPAKRAPHSTAILPRTENSAKLVAAQVEKQDVVRACQRHEEGSADHGVEDGPPQGTRPLDRREEPSRGEEYLPRH